MGWLWASLELGFEYCPQNQVIGPTVGPFDSITNMKQTKDSPQVEQNSDSVLNLGYACLDLERQKRRGFPEVVYGPGKSLEHLRGIVTSLLEHHANLLVTRLEDETAAALLELHPELQHDAQARLLYRHGDREIRGLGKVCVLSAGTSDLPVAMEAQRCAEVMGNECELLCDVGVAGLHRLLRRVEQIREARVIICVAGMEAALPSVVAGLVARPVIAVPTSVGYGTNLGGLSALLGCLNSCAAGVTTVNIDNGFGAAYAASLMNRP